MCAAGEICNAGVCHPPSLPPTELCGGACVDTTTARVHCGACGRTGGSSELCVAGECVAFPSGTARPTARLCAAGTRYCEEDEEEEGDAAARTIGSSSPSWYMSRTMSQPPMNLPFT